MDERLDKTAIASIVLRGNPRPAGSITDRIFGDRIVLDRDRVRRSINPAGDKGDKYDAPAQNRGVKAGEVRLTGVSSRAPGGRIWSSGVLGAGNEQDCVEKMVEVCRLTARKARACPE